MGSDEDLDSGRDGHTSTAKSEGNQSSVTAVLDDSATLDQMRMESGSLADSRVVAALEEYLDALRSGSPPSRQDILDRHPDIAERLSQCLSGLELVHAAGWTLGLGPNRLAPTGSESEVLESAALLGDYQIVRELGRGSMGVVYEARQISLGRRVALKVLPLISAIDPRQRQRFLIEAQSAAQLHHPHIVPVFAAGCERGVHYYAMRYVDGHSLAELPGSFSEGVSGIARLGIQAAQALEHAHNLGVVHRDIKPANLLLDSQGDLWVADFGLAHFRGDISLTLSGDLVGTLRYMSPEQALARRGVVDQRTDIYALGLTLYELLTHRPAFDGRDHQELLRQIAQDEPVPPRRIDPSIPRDLETIVLKATSKEPAGRYATAQDLADDLTRFREDRPILARRPTFPERSLRWARRHRQIVITAVTVLLLAFAAGTTVVWLQARKTEALRQRQHRYILTSFPAIDMITMTAMQRMTEARMGPGSEVELVMTRELYEKALAFYKLAAELPPTDLASRIILARAMFRMGFTHAMMSGAFSRSHLLPADSCYRDAIVRFEALLAEAPKDTDVRRYFADALGEWGLGWFLAVTQSLKSCEPYYRRAMELRRALVLDPKTDPGVLADEIVKLVQLARSLATILEADGRMQPAGELRRDLVVVCQTLVERTNPELRMKLSDSLGMYGRSLVVDDQRRDGVELLRLALILNPEQPWFLNNLAWALVSDPVTPPFEPTEGMDAIRKAVAHEPKNWELWNTLGVASYRLKDWKAASEALETSMSLHQGGDANDWFFLAMTRWQQDQKAEAQKWFDRAVEWTRKNQPRNHELRRFQAEAQALLHPSASPANANEKKPASAGAAVPITPPGRSQ